MFGLRMLMTAQGRGWEWGGVLTQPLIHIWENYIKKHRAGGCKSIQKASGESKKNIITGQKNKT